MTKISKFEETRNRMSEVERFKVGSLESCLRSFSVLDYLTVVRLVNSKDISHIRRPDTLLGKIQRAKLGLRVLHSLVRDHLSIRIIK